MRRPTYRRRYVRRMNKTPYRKRIAKMGVPKRRAVVHLINKRVETKRNYQSYTGNLPDANVPYSCEMLQPILNGTASDARIGDAINLANLKITYRYNVSGRLERDFSHKVTHNPTFINTAGGRRQPDVGR